MKIEKIVCNNFATNCYLLIQDKEVVIIDPGFYFEDEKKYLLNLIKENSLKPILAIATHGHIDHIFGMSLLKKNFNTLFYINALEIDLLKVAKKHAKFYFDIEMEEPPEPDKFIKENDIILPGKFNLRILEVPGHTEGHIIVISDEEKAVFTGDTLFRGVIGRTDLPGGDLETLLYNIHNKILTLPEDYNVYPGHGGNTTIGQEKRNNPFL